MVKVLVVEDEASIREMIRMLFTVLADHFSFPQGVGMP